MLLLAGGRAAAAHQQSGAGGTTDAQRDSPHASRGEQEADSFEILGLRTRHRFESDGTGERSFIIRSRANDQAGLASVGIVTVVYLAEEEEIAAFEVSVTKPDGRVVVPEKLDVDDATLTGVLDEPLFTNGRIRRASVPDVAVGDVVELRATVRVRRAIVPGEFWAQHTFLDTTREGETLEIDVPAIREIAVDARKALVGGRAADSPPGRHVWRWTRAPTVSAEAGAGEVGDSLRDDVLVSSFGDWADVARWYHGLVRERAVVTGAVRAKAEALTGNIADAQEKLRALHDFVATEIRYVSLALGPGRYRPRPAELVLTTKYGDCKDKHTLLAALAAAAGIEIEPVLIDSQRRLVAGVPSPGQFDHLISVLRRGSSPAEWVWMDSTSGLAPMGVLLPALWDREALAAQPLSEVGGGQIVRTPPGFGLPSVVKVDVKGRVAETGRITATLRHRFEGTPALAMRATLKAAPESMRKEFAQASAKDAGFKSGDGLTLTGLDALAPWLEMSVEARYDMAASVLRKPWTFWPPAPKFVIPSPPESEPSARPLTLGGPLTLETSVSYELPEGIGVGLPVPVRIERPFGTFWSEYAVSGRTVTVRRRLAIDVAELQPAQFDQFRAFKRAVEADRRQEFALGAMAARSASAQADWTDLNARMLEAIERREWASAIDAGTRAVEKDPTNRHAWNNLGRAYHGAGRYRDAIAAYRKQIDINPEDEYAWNNLGLAHQALNEADEAIAAFRRQIDVQPLDRYAHRNLGLLLAERRDFAAAADSLERAVAIAPDDRWLRLQLGRAYLETGRTDRAIALFDDVMSGTPDAWVWNEAAYWQAEHGVELDRALRHAEAAVGMVAVTLNHATAADERLLVETAALAAYWDTLGWVHVKRGDLDRGDPYLRAAWELVERDTVARHLADVYEKRGNRPLAQRILAQACSATVKREGPACDRWRALAGAAGVSAELEAAYKEMIRARTITLPQGTEAPLDGYVRLLIDGGGRVLDVQVESKAPLEPVVPALRAVTITRVEPHGQRVNVVRRAAVQCPGRRRACTVVFAPPVRDAGAAP